jgi:O-antigen/teichoic acid export membrane protein
MLGQFISILFATLSSIFVARYLGPTNYGLIAVAMTPMSVATLFGNFGISSALTRYIAQYRSENKADELKTIIKTGLLLKATLGAFLSLLIFSLSGLLSVKVFHQPELKLLIEITSVLLFSQAILSTSHSIFIGFERMELHSLTKIINAILRLLIAPSLVYLGYGAFGAILGNTTPIVITGILGITIIIMTFLKDGSSNKDTLSYLQASKLLLSYGFPLFLSAILISGYNQICYLLIALNVDPSMIGNFRVATNFSVFITFITTPVASVLFPLFSQLDVKENSTLRFAFQNSVKYIAFIIVPVIAALMAFSGQMIRIVFGNHYQTAPLFLTLFMAAFLYEGLGTLCSVSMLKGQGKTKIVFLRGLGDLCIRLPLCIILIPRFGIVGMLLINLLPRPGSLFTLWWIKKNYGFTINWLASAKIYVSAGITYLTVTNLLSVFHYSDWVDLLLGGSVFFIIYSLLITLIGALEKNDIQNLKNITSALGPLEVPANLFLNLIERIMRIKNP